jgi:hypothetical protein
VFLQKTAVSSKHAMQQNNLHSKLKTPTTDHAADKRSVLVYASAVRHLRFSPSAGQVELFFSFSREQRIKYPGSLIALRSPPVCSHSKARFGDPKWHWSGMVQVPFPSYGPTEGRGVYPLVIFGVPIFATETVTLFWGANLFHEVDASSDTWERLASTSARRAGGASAMDFGAPPRPSADTKGGAGGDGAPITELMGT